LFLGIPFLFQHGLGANLMQPQTLLDNLAGVQLISADCPGHGQSPLPTKQSPSFDYYADEIKQLMDTLTIKKAILGGISMGAGIAINMALRYPKKVQAVVLVRPAWLASPNPENLLILNKAAAFIKEENGSTAFKKERDYIKVANKLPLAARSILGVFAKSQRKEIPIVLESMVNSAPFNQLSELATLKIPCLIIGNDDDPLHPFEMAKTLRSAIPNSELKKIVSRYINNGQHKRLLNYVVSDFVKKL